MADSKEIEKLVIEALQRALALGSSPLIATQATVLSGADAEIESFTFVNLIVTVEEEVEKKYGKSIALLEADTNAAEDSLQTVSSLARFIAAQIS